MIWEYEAGKEPTMVKIIQYFQNSDGQGDIQEDKIDCRPKGESHDR